MQLIIPKDYDPKLDLFETQRAIKKDEMKVRAADRLR